jgi:hypothetical protein
MKISKNNNLIHLIWHRPKIEAWNQVWHQISPRISNKIFPQTRNGSFFETLIEMQTQITNQFFSENRQ